MSITYAAANEGRTIWSGCSTKTHVGHSRLTLLTLGILSILKGPSSQTRYARRESSEEVACQPGGEREASLGGGPTRHPGGRAEDLDLGDFCWAKASRGTGIRPRSFSFSEPALVGSPSFNLMKATDEGSTNYDLLDDYAVWFGSYGD
jgi:hypothetical protein